MKITGLEVFCLDYKMPYPLTYARGEYQTREALLVKVYTDDPDIFGWGEAAMWGGPWATTATVLEKQIQPLIVGHDPRRPEFLWEKVYSGDLLPRAQGHTPVLPFGGGHRVVGYSRQGVKPAGLAAPGWLCTTATRLRLIWLLPARLLHERSRRRCVSGPSCGLPRL